MGAAAWRGIATESGVEIGLFNPDMPVEECQEHARKEFARKTALSGDPKREKEAGFIEPGVAIALTELRQYGVPEKPADGRQHKIETKFEGVPVPFIGYLDFIWPQHGLIVDLKTQWALTKRISDPHARQGAIYAHAKANHEVRLAYTTPKKIGCYRLEDVADWQNQVVKIAQCIERLLSLSDDAEEITRAIAPDYSSFFWNNQQSRSDGREVWGF